MADDMTDEDRLAELDDAIQDVAIGGQKKTIRGKSVEYASLKDLQAQRDVIAARLTRGLPTSTYIRRRRG